ncbi:MAG: DUF935 domain-containing protein [Candidatus Sumerlaeaceae bacterium]|nr:DUF935 domain-containing protein [Candidatus Sumerlaeaceae bacterium]
MDIPKVLGRTLAPGVSPRPADGPALPASERSGWGDLYPLFARMEDSDPHLCSLLQTRRNALLACDWRLVAAGDSSRDRVVAGTVSHIIARIPDFRAALCHLLDAFGKGQAVIEILWHRSRTNGPVEIASLAPRDASFFATDTDGNLHLLDFEGASRPSLQARTELLPRPGETAIWHRGSRLLPERKFIRFLFQPGPDRPYGSPLCARAYWYYWFKKNNLRFWAIHNEKYGTPTVMARYGASATAQEIRDIEGVLQRLQTDSGLVLPEGIAIELLEAKRGGIGPNSFRELADWCNEEMSKLVLGQTLSSAEGRRTGSLALGEVHERVRKDYTLADARALGTALTSQLVRWIVDFNFGPDVPAPELVFDVVDPAEMRDNLALDQELIRMGVALPAAYFYQRYQRPAPTASQRSLRYDDANLYQYHLQYGVLTINEVRATLGLEAVPWGNRPPRRQGNAAAQEMDRDSLREMVADSAATEEAADRRKH